MGVTAVMSASGGIRKGSVVYFKVSKGYAAGKVKKVAGTVVVIGTKGGKEVRRQVDRVFTPSEVEIERAKKAEADLPVIAPNPTYSAPPESRWEDAAEEE